MTLAAGSLRPSGITPDASVSAGRLEGRRRVCRNIYLPAHRAFSVVYSKLDDGQKLRCPKFLLLFVSGASSCGCWSVQLSGRLPDVSRWKHPEHEQHATWFGGGGRRMEGEGGGGRRRREVEEEEEGEGVRNHCLAASAPTQAVELGHRALAAGLADVPDLDTALAAGVDVARGVADGHGAHHFPVAQRVDLASVTRDARANQCVRREGHRLHLTIGAHPVAVEEKSCSCAEPTE
ncbi:hypothetical protein EYF80_045625 [Liparis tanakae]|uniref:Uncharacterized protein n=1 Tax=Liparis tanakae TaxID=230148 RepID=A0A4Z2FTJ1_9TELE|nr:hypothetical protein EYF80_045625 [Liparis tanakae]